MFIRKFSKYFQSHFYYYYYYFEYSDYRPHLYCHTHNISADMFFSLLQVFCVELASPHRISG